MNYPIRLNLSRPIDQITTPQLVKIVASMVEDGGLYEIDASKNNHSEVASIIESIRVGLKRPFQPSQDQQYHWIDPSALVEEKIEGGIRFIILWKDQNKMTCKSYVDLKLVEKEEDDK